MKSQNLQLLFLAAVCLFVFTGCAAVQEVGDDVTTKFDEGITGRGRLVSPDQTGDSFGSYYD